MNKIGINEDIKLYLDESELFKTELIKTELVKK